MSIEPVTRFQKFLRVLADSSADMPEPLREVEKVCCYACGHLDSYPTPNTRMEKLIASVRDKSIVPPAPVTNLEKYIAAMAGEWTDELPEPVTSEEKILYDVASGEDVTLSGNPLVLANALARPLKECAVSWQPTQSGTGTPSPDNIRPISGRTSVKVERCGENLLDAVSIFPAKKVSNGITWTNNKDGSVSADGTATSTGYYDSAAFILAAGTYTICAMPKFRITVLRRDDRTSIAASAVGTSKTFTLNENTKCACFIACVGTFSNEIGYPCIVQGAVDTGWTQYRGDTTTLTLPRTIYGGEVDAQTGEGQETWKLLTLDGTENWIAPSSNAYYAVFGYSPSDNSTNGIASHYPYGTGTKNMFVNKNGAVVVYGLNDSTTLDEWKTYLASQYAAGTPVQIAYKLATPTAFTATGGAEIKALQGTNTLLTEADTITATYRCNVNAAEAEVNALYTDLLNEVEE